jgi:hypothetical protein
LFSTAAQVYVRALFLFANSFMTIELDRVSRQPSSFSVLDWEHLSIPP